MHDLFKLHTSHYTQGRPQDLGGGARILFRFWNLHVAMLGGFGGMLPRESFFKTVQFGAFFIKKIPFFKIKNKYFKHTLAMG